MPEKDGTAANCFPADMLLDSNGNTRALTQNSDLTCDSPDKLQTQCAPLAMSKVSVAFVVNRFNKGGMERCIARVVNRLDRQRFSPAIFCLDRSGTAEKWLSKSDVPIIELRKGKGNDWGVVSRLSKSLSDHGIDIVHSHNWGTLVECSLACRRAGIIHVHAERGSMLGSDHPSRWKQHLRKIAMKWALRSVNQVTTNSQCIADRIAGACQVPRDSIRIIPNGVDNPVCQSKIPGLRQRTREKLGISDQAVVIGSVGRFAKVKNFPLAIQVLRRLRQRDLNVVLLLVGDGPERETILREVERQGVAGECCVPGMAEEPWSFLSAMDVYINCSTSEGMSQSIVEAMAVGLPVVASDVGDAKCMLKGELDCGEIFASADLDGFSLQLTELVSDPAKRRRMGEAAGQLHRLRYSQQAMIDEFEFMYGDLFARVHSVEANTR